MKKGIWIAVACVLAVVGALAAVKVLQIRAMIEHGKKAVVPPETVTTFVARADSWDRTLSAVGSLVAVQGVTVAAEVSGKVVEIAFQPGAKAKAGDLLVRQDTGVEEALLPGAEAQVKLAESVVARDNELLSEKIIAQAEYDLAIANRQQAIAQRNGIRATIAKKSIIAPFAGRLGIRQVNLGQILREGDPVVTLQSLDPIHVDFALPQQESGRVRTGMPVRIASDAFPGLAVEGPVTTINPLVDRETRNLRIQATVANPDEKLRPGMFVNVTVRLPEKGRVIAIPATAVLYAPFGDSVFVVRDDREGKGGKVLEQKFVRLGEKRGDFVAVAEGLAGGDTVVSTGVFKLRNGQAVVVDNRLAPKFRLDPSPKDE